jgi:hypothetical protein
MQTLACYLYPILLECQVITNESTTTRYPIVYANRIKLYKHANNQIKLLFKNNDQKSIDFAGYTVQFNIFKNQTSPAKSTAVTIPIPAAVGTTVPKVSHAVLTINSILDDLEPGLYNYSIDTAAPMLEQGVSVLLDPLLYTDDNYSVVGELEVILIHQTTPSAVTLVPNLGVTNYAAGNSQQHTFQFNYSNFTGTVTFQASLDPQPGTSNSWFTFATVAPVAANTNMLYTYTGSYVWVRVRVTTTSGTISNILYLS